MRIFNYKFTPGIWPTVIFVLLLPLFIYLGCWQLSRADEKQQLYDEYNIQKSLPAVSLNQIVTDLDDLSGLVWKKVILSGRLMAENTILLDNKIINGNVGYYVFIPFESTNDNRFVLVNMGWVSAEKDRKKIPDLKPFKDQIVIEGYLKQPQYSGVKWSETPIEEISDNIIRVQNIDYDQLAEFYDKDFERIIVRISSESTGPYYTKWPEPGFGMEKHKGYAFQWFCFAAVLVFLFFYLNIKRND